MSELQKLATENPNVRLKHTLLGHTNSINTIAWSPDGKVLASTSFDHTVRLWDVDSGKLIRAMEGHQAPVYGVAWSPDSKMLVSGSHDMTVRIWDAKTAEELATLSGPELAVYTVAWSPDGEFIASGDLVTTINIWDAKTRKLIHTLRRHADDITCLAWSCDGKILASSSDDRTIKLWDNTTFRLLASLEEHMGEVSGLAWCPVTGVLASASFDRTIKIWRVASPPRRLKFTLEGHTQSVKSVAFSFDGLLLASRCSDGTVRLWDCDAWKTLAEIQIAASSRWEPTLAFHPKSHMLATSGDTRDSIRIWELNLEGLLNTSDEAKVLHYRNAKVVLLGDAGVGKTGLARALAGFPFRPTESTHGRHVITLSKQEVELKPGCKELREIYLWDLAGQPDYRLIHQLHLNDTTIAVIVFDGFNTRDPLDNVYYWDRAVRQARREQGNSPSVLKKFLVAARIDQRGVGIDRSTVESLVLELGFSDYFLTSAKADSVVFSNDEKKRIQDLAQRLSESIVWESIPYIVSDQLFKRIKDFIQREKQSGVQLAAEDFLYRQYLETRRTIEKDEALPSHFKTCISHLESQGLVRSVSFGNLILLQPELLDAYASGLIIAAKSEPTGLGCIEEENARAGRFKMPESDRIQDREYEQLLLIAIIEDMLRHEIAFRLHTDEGSFITFPSQITREKPIRGQAVVYRFEGPITSIYTTLAVRLAQTGKFTMKDMWKDTVEYTTASGSKCGIQVHEIKEAAAELMLFYESTEEETRIQFEEFVYTHILRRALPESIVRTRRVACPSCDTSITDEQVLKRKDKGFAWISCGICSTRISLIDHAPLATGRVTPRVTQMINHCNENIAREVGIYKALGESVANDFIRNFDVFLCYNSSDVEQVTDIGKTLKQHGLSAWLDIWELRPGLPWHKVLEYQIKNVKTAVVFVGNEGVGPWQSLEIESLLRKFVNQGSPVIPVILKECIKEPVLPLFLGGLVWVDFRREDPDPFEQLLWGITGVSPHSHRV